METSAEYIEQVIRKAAIYRPAHLRREAVLSLRAFAFQHDCLLTDLWSRLMCDHCAKDAEDRGAIVDSMLRVFSDRDRLQRLLEQILDIDAQFPRMKGEVFDVTADELREELRKAGTDINSWRTRLERLLSHHTESDLENT